MEQGKITHDRFIKRETYKIGDKVLANHPKLAKGQKQGLAYKYYGPFIITGINTNGCNYTIRKDKKGARSKQIHKNNLKIYYERGRDPYEEPAFVTRGTNTEAWSKDTLTKSTIPPAKQNQQPVNEQLNTRETSNQNLRTDTDSTHPNSDYEDPLKSFTGNKIPQKRKYTKRTIRLAPTHSRSGRALVKRKN